MTKHLMVLMIKRHVEKLCLSFRDGRAEKAAKLHSSMRNSRIEVAQSKLRAINEGLASVAGDDYWSQKGEAGRWVRIYGTPRTSAFFALEGARRSGKKHKAHFRMVYHRSCLSLSLSETSFQGR